MWCATQCDTRPKDRRSRFRFQLNPPTETARHWLECAITAKEFPKTTSKRFFDRSIALSRIGIAKPAEQAWDYRSPPAPCACITARSRPSMGRMAGWWWKSVCREVDPQITQIMQKENCQKEARQPKMNVAFWTNPNACES